MKAWLKFFRVVNLPTVPGDVLVGVAAVVSANGWAMGFGVPAAACVVGVFLYMFGLADNDIVGARSDSDRPIPCGEISLGAARWARGLCLFAALVVGALANLQPAWWITAFALSAAIVVYNRTKWCFPMGVCRGLNVACGAAAVLPSPDATEMSRPLWLASGLALVWTVYIAAVTKYSEGEEMNAVKKRRVGFLIGAIVYLQLIALLIFRVDSLLLTGAALLVVLRLMKRLLPGVSAS